MISPTLSLTDSRLAALYTMYRYDKKSGDKGWGTQLSRDPRKQRTMTVIRP